MFLEDNTKSDLAPTEWQFNKKAARHWTIKEKTFMNSFMRREVPETEENYRKFFSIFSKAVVKCPYLPDPSDSELWLYLTEDQVVEIITRLVEAK